MKKILVPVDFSKASENAVLSAYEIAKKTNAELHFLHLIKTKKDLKIKSNSEVEKYPDVTKQLDVASKKMKALQEQFSDAKTFVHYTYNNKLSAILGDIENLNPDLLVISAFGVSGRNDMVIGSVAKIIIRNANCPVLTVKNKVVKKWENVLFASDFKEEREYFTPSFKQLVNDLDLHLQLVFVNTPTYFKTTDVMELKMQTAIKKHKSLNCSMHIYNYHEMLDGVLSFADREKSDIIAIATEGRKGWSRFFNPSLTEELALASERPVLSFNFMK